MITHDIEQGTDEWFEVRKGKLTASDAQAIANNGKGLETLIFEKVAEVLTGKIKEQYTNEDMERGKVLEAMARNSYELETGNAVQQVGFVELDEDTGCSPDGLVEEKGLIEIKCKNNALFARFLYEMKVDPEFDWQMQMQMFVTGREWCDLVIFNENFPKTTIIIRVFRNETSIAKLKASIAIGIAQKKAILAKIKS